MNIQDCSNAGCPRISQLSPSWRKTFPYVGIKIQTPQGGYPVSETYSNMENVIQIGQVVQPSVLSEVERTVKNLKAWLNAKSPSFSALAGEDVSHADVVKAHLYLFIVFVIGVVVSQMGGAI